MDREAQPTAAVASPTRQRIAAVALAVAATLVAVGGVQAASHTWTGATDGNFETGANWGGTAPSSDLTSSIGVFSGTPTVNQPALSVSRSINALQFTTATGGWTLGGAPAVLTIGGGGINTTGQTSGTNTISAPVTLGASQVWQVGTGGTLAVSGGLSGTSSVTLGATGKTGLLTLTGVSTYTGTITTAFGTLELNSAGVATSGNVSISNGATLRLAGTGGDQIANARSVTVNGTFDLNGRQEVLNTFSGATTGLITNTSATAAKLSVGNGSNFSGQVNDGVGTVALQMSNQALTLSGNNNYSGGTTMSGGTLNLGSNTAAGTGGIVAGAAIIRSDSITDRVLANAVTFTNNLTFGSSTTGALTFASLTGSVNATITVLNTSTTLTGNMTVTGGTHGKAGTGALIVKGNYAQTGGAYSITSGAMAVEGTYSNLGKAQLNGGQLGTHGTLSAALNAANGVTWSNGATGGLFAYGPNAAWGNAANNLSVNFGGAGASVQWNGTGSSFVSTGATLRLGNALSNGTLTLVNALNLNGATQTLNVAAGSTNSNAAADAMLTGVISNGGLNVTGTGTLALTNANMYAGGTTFDAGKLLLTNTSGSATGTGPVTINAGTLATAAVGSAAGTVTLAGTGKISPGDAAAGVLSVGGLTLTGGTTLDFNNTGDRIDVAAALAYTGSGAVEVRVPPLIGAPYTLISFLSTTATVGDFILAPGTDPSYTLVLNGTSLVVAVPEPATFGMAAVAAVGALVGRRRRRV